VHLQISTADIAGFPLLLIVVSAASNEVVNLSIVALWPLVELYPYCSLDETTR
jgi:hypothetical protein